MSSLSAFLQGTTGLALLPPPPLGWVRALSKRSGAGYFFMKGHQIFEPTVDENEAAQHSSFARQIIRSKVCPNDSHHRYIWKIYWLGGLWRSAWQNEERGSGITDSGYELAASMSFN